MSDFPPPKNTLIAVTPTLQAKQSNVSLKTSIGGVTFTMASSKDIPRQDAPQEVVRLLLEKYPLISIDDKFLGEPRIANSRFGVTDVLSALTYYESFAEVISEYGDIYTKEELKAAVDFARDFIDSFYVGR